MSFFVAMPHSRMNALLMFSILSAWPKSTIPKIDLLRVSFIVSVPFAFGRDEFETKQMGPLELRPFLFDCHASAGEIVLS